MNLNQLRADRGTVDRAAITLPADREIEQSTINRTTTLGIDYSPSVDWGINLQLPYLNRSRTTIVEGDANLFARYQGLTPMRNIGLQFGLKLPTGDYKTNFNRGLQQGQPLDRGWQPGTGTTDLMWGAFYTGTASDDIDYFVQGLVQTPINSRVGFRPGASLNINLGLRYVGIEKMTCELQFNARTMRRDSGAYADRDNSGGTRLYLTLGVTLGVMLKLKLFGFVQVPLYQHVVGY